MASVPIRRLIFSGGGTRVIAFLSAIRELESANKLRDVREWWGSSAGAFLATLYALSGSAKVLESTMRKTQFTRFRDVDLMNLVNLTTTWGMDDGTSMMAEVERIMESVRSGSSKHTMSDIPGLHIFAADMNDHAIVDLCAEKTPTILVRDALRASMSLPIMYTPVVDKRTGHYLIDGGIATNFPWNQLRNDEEKRESLGFAFERTWEYGPRSFKEFIFAMTRFGEPNETRGLRLEWPANIIWFASPPFPAWFMNLQEEEYKLLETLGLEAYKSWLKRLTSDSKMPQSPPLSALPHTPLPAYPTNHIDGMLDTPKHSCPPQPPCPPPSQDSQPEVPRLSRRWSW